MDKRINKIVELIENNVDEVSQDTLQSYREKRLKEPLDNRSPKKTKGIQRSYAKLMYKINKDKQGTFGDNKGYGQGRYMGDSVEEDLDEGDRSEFSANQHLSSIPSNSSAKKFRLIHKKTGSTRGIFNSHAEAMKAHGSHPMKSQLTVEEVEGDEEDDDDINEKTLTPAELKKREEVAKALERDDPTIDMGKKMAIATTVAKRVAEEVDESMEARTQSGRKMVSAEAALRHAREIAHARSPGSKPTMADIAAAHKKLSSGVNEADEHKVGDSVRVISAKHKGLTGNIEKIYPNKAITVKHSDGSARTYHASELARHLNESFVVKDPTGKTVAVKYSDGEAKKHAEELSKKTGQKHTVSFERSAMVKEDTEGKDTVRLEIPALIRALEWAREDAEDDVEIHKFVEKLINHEGTVDMKFFSEGVIPSADRKVDKNGRPYPAHQVHVGTNESFDGDLRGYNIVDEIESTSGEILGLILKNSKGYAFYDDRKHRIESGYSSAEEAKRGFISLHKSRFAKA